MQEKDMRLALKRYLGQYYRAKLKQKQLESRLNTLREEMSSVRGMRYSAVPRAPSGTTSSTTEDKIIRLMEIEERITKQQDKVQKAMLSVMDIMEYLPIDSTERIVLEYRHIDCLSWKQIEKNMNYSRGSCNNYYNAGIEKIMGNKNVQKIINRII